MGLIKYRDTDGTIRELLCLKGEKGDKGDTGSVNNHSHDLTEITCQGYDNAYGFVEDVRGHADVAEQQAFDAIDKATKAFEAVGQVESDARTANDKADYLLEQMGNVETALDTIIAIQNELIGGDGK